MEILVTRVGKLYRVSTPYFNNLAEKVFIDGEEPGVSEGNFEIVDVCDVVVVYSKETEEKYGKDVAAKIEIKTLPATLMEKLEEFLEDAVVKVAVTKE
ncbi:MAG: hypothetical protein QXV17_02620 [Candidatus Micrarchaeaceae archaeon]